MGSQLENLKTETRNAQKTCWSTILEIDAGWVLSWGQIIPTWPFHDIWASSHNRGVVPRIGMLRESRARGNHIAFFFTQDSEVMHHYLHLILLAGELNKDTSGSRRRDIDSIS